MDFFAGQHEKIHAGFFKGVTRHERWGDQLVIRDGAVIITAYTGRSSHVHGAKAVAKRQRREKLVKREQRKVQTPK